MLSRVLSRRAPPALRRRTPGFRFEQVRQASSWIGPVCGGAVADRGDADRAFVVGELVDDSVGADPQRAKASEGTA